MQLINRAMAGTLESSDAQISIAPGKDGIVLHIQSTVQNQYGRAIKQSVLDTLSKLGIENAEVDVNDRGARLNARCVRAWNARHTGARALRRAYHGRKCEHDTKEEAGKIQIKAHHDIPQRAEARAYKGSAHLRGGQFDA